ncbi:MAG: CoA-binding protein [Bacteroidota bacterium]
MQDYLFALQSARTIAVVGCSGHSGRTSHSIARYLLSNDIEVIPVNPNYEEILGLTCYPDLHHIPEEIRIDIVNIFRRPAFTKDVVEMTAEFAKQRGYRPLIWTQLGVSTREAEQLAEAHELPYVRNRCIMVEHRLEAGRFNP